MNDKQEKLIREYVRRKISVSLNENRKFQKKVLKEEQRLRKIIRELLKEGDISDMHPHRSTGINVLEDVLKKMITTLRTDYKRMTTSKSQRDSFRAHMISAVKAALAPSLVNDTYLQDTDTLLSEPTPEISGSEQDDLDLALEEVDIEIEDEDKKIPVEDDDKPDEKDSFGVGLEDLDETGRNMAFTTFKKISQYILDAYDLLRDPKDKKVFVDYLITNTKLYLDKFEDELQNTVDEPTTPEYENTKGV